MKAPFLLVSFLPNRGPSKLFVHLGGLEGRLERLSRPVLVHAYIPETAESRSVYKWLFPPRFSDKTDLPPAAQIMRWLLQSLQKHENNKLLQWGGFFGVAGGN
jgi:hypothetical protein